MKNETNNWAAQRILLVDDEPALLDVAAQFLARHLSIKVIGRALSGEDALALAGDLKPDVVLMDMVMPAMDGLEATAWLKSMPDAPKVIAISGHDTPEMRAAAFSAGADAFVPKTELTTSLLPLMLRVGRMNPQNNGHAA